MPSPKSGTACTCVAPADPTAPTSPADSVAGQLESVLSGTSNTSSYTYDSQTVSGPVFPTDDGGDASSSSTNTCEQPPAPTITASWSKNQITVDHNATYPPASAPTDTVPEEAKVQMVVDTTNVPDGTAAAITIYNAHTNSSVENGSFTNLIVQGNKVVDKATCDRPLWSTLTNSIWDPWDHPLFYFKATVDYESLQAHTPVGETAALRVLYWDVCVCDAIADSPAGGGLSTAAEMKEIAGLLGAVAHHKVQQQTVNQRVITPAQWGSFVRNTYTYHHGSHGDIVDRKTQAQLNDGKNNPPTAAVGNWRSVIVLGNTNLGDAEVTPPAKVPTTPRFLVYFDTCVAGWEPSFANAITSRGTRNVIAFRCYIPDNDARTMARNFYTKWCKTHKCNPAKIPDVFFDVGSPYYASMRPMLYGEGGGAIIDLSAILKAIIGPKSPPAAAD